MKPLDQGGFPVFKDETNVENRLPMGVALYKSPIDSAFYVIVGRKTGPEKGYLYQYKLTTENNLVKTTLVRKFGNLIVVLNQN